MTRFDTALQRPQWRGRSNVDRLTIAVVERAEHLAKKRFTKMGKPGRAHKFVITQGSYQPTGGGDPNSAGTHHGGGVIDLRWCGHAVCVWALRRAGAAAWYRSPKQGPWVAHIHAVVIGHPALSPAAARQVDAYIAGRNGLANNGPDDGPRLKQIKLPVYPWPNTINKRLRNAIKKLRNARKALKTAHADSTSKAQRKRIKNARKRAKRAIKAAKNARKVKQ